ncbi:MAG: pyridoxal 5'-phosphate synthase [Proteobacteria bacterium]|nr:pyridoxal 5'-phosphate synthase [Pseudomonadota bacterium]
MSKNNSTDDDPIKIFLDWYLEAQTGMGSRFTKNRVISTGTHLLRRMLSAVSPWANLFRPDIATLATISPESRPSARSVLFKGLVEGGFSFYTDYESDKGKELEINPSAVMVFYWHFPPRQVRIDGKVCKLSRKAAENDWKSRTRENQTASLALRQSSIIRGRDELVEKANYAKLLYRGKPIPCPDSWGGYRLVPYKIEFWEGRFDWLHHREKYLLNNGCWEKVYLAP